MTLISALILLVVLVVIGYVAYWIITKFFPEPIRNIALIVVGVLLLIVLLVQFFPGAANFHVWR